MILSLSLLQSLFPYEKVDLPLANANASSEAAAAGSPLSIFFLLLLLLLLFHLGLAWPVKQIETIQKNLQQQEQPRAASAQIRYLAAATTLAESHQEQKV
jgi:flagellar biogenesis protein FliO